ncbi:PLD nuclease N-terminal domain-containing protein [Paenibacillus sp. CF384]|uniref:PLD nuclease N-terminal domain-containing protein n=1 Tax=Paenibacillus sp. CF384 TaxID=1884382 RepID=UPI00089C5F8C|nr:PLD nuclease N-terminal domain-containing protein [Paenibacillus sp. CF384]SDX44249.1 Phospholipase_D-nuclease N-terminal [Paenibacillus sp. CF384]
MDDFSNKMLLSLVLPFLIVQLILMVTALVVCARAAETRGPKWMWVLIIIFLNLLGSVLFFLFGRKQSS